MVRNESHVEREELVLFCRQFGAMLEAGTDILRVLTVLRDQTSNNVLKQVFSSIERDLRLGRTLSRSLGRFPDIFNPFFIDMVRQGEREDILPQVFIKLAEHLSRPVELEFLSRSEPSLDHANLLADRLWPMFSWMSLSMAAVAIGIALLLYATQQGWMPRSYLSANVCLLVGVMMLVSYLIFYRLRPRHFNACTFCGRPESASVYFKRSVGAAICDQCLERGYEAVQSRRRAAEQPVAETLPAPAAEPTKPKPQAEEEEEEFQIVREEEDGYY
ncbi:MAG: type II secretion system F family protein [Abditibacteriales bacterium]|nr:type II secretion system F family protein [Abditibacteriales bacterium]MDW8365219.1 type II secretion system F family protein [Abditibacteriales bacterium]